MRVLITMLAFMLTLSTNVVGAMTADEFRAKAAILEAELVTMKQLDPSYPVKEQHQPIRVHFEKVSRLAGQAHSQLVPSYDGNVFTIKVHYTETVEKNPGLLLKDMALIREVLRTILSFGKRYTTLASFHNWYELYENAKADYPRAQERIASLNLQLASREPAQETMAMLKSVFGPIPQENSYIERNWSEATRTHAITAKRAEAFEAKLNKEYKKWVDNDVHRDEYERMDEKLNDLVLKNDRAGVRKMIEAYLPWGLMAPTEVRAWQGWLEAMEHPRKDKTIFAFRGVEHGNDRVQRKQLANGENQFGFLSTVLTKNQGSYTRRLRSLVTNRMKNGLSGGELGENDARRSVKAPALGPSAPITNQMWHHAGNPAASNFISFTDRLLIASVFSNYFSPASSDKTKPQGGLLAVRIDSRRIFANVLQHATTEREYLVPLVIFPDEVVTYVETSGDADALKAEFVRVLKAKTGIDAETYIVPNEVYRATGYKFLNEIRTESRNSMSACKAQF